MVLFPDIYEATHEILIEDAVVKVNAKVDNRNDRIQLIAQAISQPESAPEPVVTRLVQIRLPVSTDVDHDIATMRQLRDLFDEFHGDDTVILRLPVRSGEMRLQPSRRVDWCADLALALEELLGPETATVTEHSGTPSSRHNHDGIAGRV